MYRSKIMRFPLAVLAMGLLSTPALSAFELAKKQIVRIGNGAEPRELDPSKSTGVPESHIIDNLFEGLTSLDPKDLSPVPGVAETWVESDDKLTYTFKLRKNAKWSDGKPLTAHDFVFAWQRALSPEFASEYAYQLYYIKNGEAYNKGDMKDPKKLGVKAKDDRTLIVTLEKPTPFFLRLTAFHTLYPVPKHVVSKFEGQEWTKVKNIVSNGPFVLAEWKLNQHIKLVPNPNYWNKDLIKLQAAYIYPIENQDTEERTFFAGKLHKTNEAPVLKIPVYERQKEKNPDKYHPYRADPYLGIYYYRLNVTKAPLNDVRVRKALVLAIDRKLITERVTRGGEQPATTFTPPNTGGYTADPMLPVTLDVKDKKDSPLAQAKKLLADAGYPDGKGFPKIEILFNTSEKHRKVALAVQQMLKKNLNIEVGLYNQEWKVYLNNQKKLNYSISRAGWIGDYPDPNTFLDMWVTGGGNNQTGWSNKEYDKLIEQASKESDQAKRYEIFQKAEKILLTELPVLPIYYYTQPTLVSEKLKMQTNDGKLIDYVSNIQDRLFLKNLVLAK